MNIISRWKSKTLHQSSQVQECGGEMHTRAIRNTDKHKAAVIIPSFIPFGYSSDCLSSAAVSRIAFSSTVFSLPPSRTVPFSGAGEGLSGFFKPDSDGTMVEAVDGSIVVVFLRWVLRSFMLREGIWRPSSLKHRNVGFVASYLMLAVVLDRCSYTWLSRLPFGVKLNSSFFNMPADSDS